MATESESSALPTGGEAADCSDMNHGVQAASLESQTNPMPSVESDDTHESGAPVQGPTTPTTREGFPQLPVTPSRPIIAAPDSPTGSTMSSPDIVRQTRLRNPFDESGTIDQVRQQLSDQQSMKEDEEDTVRESHNRFEQDEGNDDAPQQMTAMSVQLPQTQDNDAAPNVVRSSSSHQLYKKRELIDMLEKQELKDVDRRQGLSRSRSSSAPPEPQSSRDPQLFGRRSNYVLRFNQKLLPPPTVPLYMEILGHIQRWGYWVAKIEDYSTRMALIHRITEKMREVWADGVKRGLIPQKAPEGQETMSRTELQEAMEEERGRQAERKKQKRQISPSKAVVIDIKRNIHTDATWRKHNYSITAGELHEAGVKWQNVLDRVSAGLLDLDRELITRTTDRLGRNYISPKDDWLQKQKPTKNNTIGRDLLLFCLWEVFRCDVQLPYLENILDMAQTDEQRNINREILETEQKLRNQLMAIALELDPGDDDDTSGEDEQNDGDDSQQAAIDIESSPEPLPSRTKRAAPANLENSGQQSEESPNTQELIPVVPLDFTNPDVFRKQVNFIGSEIRPKANALLDTVGVEPLDDTTNRWTPISSRLQETDITSDQINKLILEINSRFSEIKTEDEREKQEEEVIRDVEGLPSRLEIWHAIPPEGFTNPELQAAFPDVSPSNTTWQKLVKSVSWLEKAAGRWLPLKQFFSNEASSRPQLATGSRPPCLKITLTLKNYPGYDPEEYSPETINHTKGFKWRYMSNSTISQRLSMDEVVEKYVEKRIDADRQKPKGVPRASQHRRGTYEVLGHPEFPDGPGVVHGIWEVRKNTDTEEPSLIWFYDGGDREVVDLGFASYEPVPQGTMEEMLQLVEARKTAQVQQEEDVNGKGPEQNAINETPVKPLGGSPEAVSDGPPKSTRSGRGNRGGPRGGRRGGRGGGRASKTKGRKRKLPDESSGDDTPRPRRKAAKVITYGDDGDDEGDEYCPE